MSAQPTPRRSPASSAGSGGRAQTLLAVETEAGFQAWVAQFAALHGWRVWHDLDARRNAPGLPDLLLVRGQRLVWAELKRQNGRVRPAQREWLAALTLVGGNVEVYLWRPCDRSVIERLLS